MAIRPRAAAIGTSGTRAAQPRPLHQKERPLPARSVRYQWVVAHHGGHIGKSPLGPVVGSDAAGTGPGRQAGAQALCGRSGACRHGVLAQPRLLSTMPGCQCLCPVQPMLLSSAAPRQRADPRRATRPAASAALPLPGAALRVAHQEDPALVQRQVVGDGGLVLRGCERTPAPAARVAVTARSQRVRTCRARSTSTASHRTATRLEPAGRYVSNLITITASRGPISRCAATGRPARRWRSASPRHRRCGCQKCA